VAFLGVAEGFNFSMWQTGAVMPSAANDFSSLH
jgi:hypothetical protein